MILGISNEKLAAYVFMFIVVIILLAILASPLKRILKILVSSVIGTVALLAFNLIGRFLNFKLGVNPASILTVGILGAPGFLLIVFLKYFLR